MAEQNFSSQRELLKKEAEMRKRAETMKSEISEKNKTVKRKINSFFFAILFRKLVL